MNRTGARLVEVGWDAPHNLLALSPVLAEVVAGSAAARQTSAVLIRRQTPYVLLGPQDARLPELTQAVQWLRAQSLPVFSRISGGSAVLLDPGCISFAVAKPCRDLTSWEQNFRQMTQGVITALRQLGFDAGFGRAVGSYCEGPYDLVVDGRKIAGVAQAIRGGFALISGMVLVTQDPVATTGLLQEFYRRAGSDRRLNPDAVTSLGQLAPQSGIDPDGVHTALVRGFSDQFDLYSDPLTTPEVDVARRLYWQRQPGLTEQEAHYASPH